MTLPSISQFSVSGPRPIAAPRRSSMRMPLGFTATIAKTATSIMNPIDAYPTTQVTPLSASVTETTSPKESARSLTGSVWNGASDSFMQGSNPPRSQISKPMITTMGGGTSSAIASSDPATMPNVPIIPRECLLETVEIGAGVFSAVWKGLLGGQLVAIKKPRISTNGLNSNLALSEVESLQKSSGNGIMGLTNSINSVNTNPTSQPSCTSTSASPVDALMREADILHRCRHPNIIDLLGICVDEMDESAFRLVLEFAPDGSLHDIITTNYAEIGLPLSLFFGFALDICDALIHLHRHCSPPVTHRDLKNHNVLVFGKRCKLADFGSAGLIAPQRFAATNTTNSVRSHEAELTARIRDESPCGSTFWSAPECYAHGHAGEPSDVYSLAMMLWQMLSGLAVRKRKPAIPSRAPALISSLLPICWKNQPAERPDLFTLRATIISDWKNWSASMCSSLADMSSLLQNHQTKSAYFDTDETSSPVSKFTRGIPSSGSIATEFSQTDADSVFGRSYVGTQWTRSESSVSDGDLSRSCSFSQLSGNLSSFNPFDQNPIQSDGVALSKEVQTLIQKMAAENMQLKLKCRILMDGVQSFPSFSEKRSRSTSVRSGHKEMTPIYQGDLSYTSLQSCTPQVASLSSCEDLTKKQYATNSVGASTFNDYVHSPHSQRSNLGENGDIAIAQDFGGFSHTKANMAYDNIASNLNMGEEGISQENCDSDSDAESQIDVVCSDVDTILEFMQMHSSASNSENLSSDNVKNEQVVPSSDDRCTVQDKVQDSIETMSEIKGKLEIVQNPSVVSPRIRPNMMHMPPKNIPKDEETQLKEKLSGSKQFPQYSVDDSSSINSQDYDGLSCYDLFVLGIRHVADGEYANAHKAFTKSIELRVDYIPSMLALRLLYLGKPFVVKPPRQVEVDRSLLQQIEKAQKLGTATTTRRLLQDLVHGQSGNRDSRATDFLLCIYGSFLEITEGNRKEAGAYFAQSANNSCLFGQFLFAEYLIRLKRKDEAIDFLAQAAEKGHARAQRTLGCLKRSIHDVGNQPMDTYTWTLLAGQQGDWEAHADLAQINYRGDSVDRDFAQAFHWAKVGAERGGSRCQTLLGLLYENGHGVGKNLSEAVRLYELAAQQGNAKASSCLERISSSSCRIA